MKSRVLLVPIHHEIHLTWDQRVESAFCPSNLKCKDRVIREGLANMISDLLIIMSALCTILKVNSHALASSNSSNGPDDSECTVSLSHSLHVRLSNIQSVSRD